MELKPGYKMTDLGVIPEDWEVKILGDCSAIYRGGSPRPIEAYLTTSNTGYNWIKIGDVQPNEKFIYKTEEKIIKEGVTRSRLVHKGDFLLSNSMSFGRPYILKIDGCIHDGWLVIQNYQASFDTNFLYYLLCSESTLKQYKIKAAGSGVLNLNKELVASIEVIHPTLAEQQAIAAALSDADALLSSLSDLIAKKRNIKKAAMQELLTGKTRLPGFQVSPALKNTEVGVIPEDWEVNCIKNLAEIKTGKKNTQDSVTGGKYPFFVRSQTVERINTYSFDGEAVLTAGDGDTGKVFHYINGKFDYHQRVYKISNFSNKLNGYFFYLYFSNYFYDRIMQMTAKSTVDSVRMEMIADMPIALPSLAEQQAIASVLSDMDAEIAALEARQEKIKHIKQGMMQNLLTGKIRLRAFCL